MLCYIASIEVPLYIYEEEERGWRTRGREKEDRGGGRRLRKVRKEGEVKLN